MTCVSSESRSAIRLSSRSTNASTPWGVPIVSRREGRLAGLELVQCGREVSFLDADLLLRVAFPQRDALSFERLVLYGHGVGRRQLVHPRVSAGDRVRFVVDTGHPL